MPDRGQLRQVSEEYTLGPKLMLVRGLVRIVPVVAYYFSLQLPSSVSQPHTSIIFWPRTPVSFLEEAKFWELWSCRNAHSKPRFDWGS